MVDLLVGFRLCGGVLLGEVVWVGNFHQEILWFKWSTVGKTHRKDSQIGGEDSFPNKYVEIAINFKI